jgi:hypothetical protein
MYNDETVVTILCFYSLLLGYSPCFSFLIFYIVSRTPWTGDQPFARPLPAHRTAQTQNKRTQIPILQLGFELTISLFERAKVGHALDHAVTVIAVVTIMTRDLGTIIIIISGVLRPLLAYCTSPRWQMRVIVEQLVELKLAGETEVLGENLPQRH